VAVLKLRVLAAGCKSLAAAVVVFVLFPSFLPFFSSFLFRAFLVFVWFVFLIWFFLKGGKSFAENLLDETKEK
jgi:hypothetical protein